MLTQPEVPKTVWLLFENEPGDSGRLVGTFSSATLAMESLTVQEIVGAGTWEERMPGLWIFKPSRNKKSYFSLECSQVDRLLRFAGSIPLDDLQLMQEAIEQGCEQVDSNQW